MGNATVGGDRILNVDQAAELAGVERADILEWIDTRGLKTTPIGTVGRRGPRRYLILESWLIDNIKAHAVSGRMPAPDTGEAEPAPRRARGSADPANPLGPKPAAKARG
jgi:hypothetical protein